jgi:hypothetical protein
MPETIRHDAFCPNCGVPRMGAFRFCLACRFDFDTVGGLGPARRPRIGRGAAGGHGDRSSRRVVVGDGAFELSPWTALVFILAIVGLSSLLVVLLSR